MIKLYRKALNYAHKLDPLHYMDLVHDAYVSWWNKKGENLFECHEGVVIQTIKNIHRSNYTRSTFMWRGIVNSKIWISYDSFDTDQSNPDLIIEYKYNHYTKTDPLNILSAKDAEYNLVKTLNSKELEVYKYSKLGYIPSEIAEELGTYRQQINHKVKAIVNKYNSINVQ